jgi:hypothetical protein
VSFARPFLPDDDRARELLALLGTEPVDAEDILRARPRPGTPDWQLLEQRYGELVAGMDGALKLLPWHAEPGDQLYPWLYLAAVPAARANHERRGVPDDVSWATLRDFGRHTSLCRRMYGHAGLDAPGWPALHFRGTLFELGRLQYERSVRPDGVTRILDLHIPESGSLSPELVDDSLQQAHAFFPKYFREERYEAAFCTSWLLDEQLAEYLPASSNIVAFQRRFHLVDEEARAPVVEDSAREASARAGDAAVAEFVFRRRRALPLDEEVLASLPQETSLQRAIVTHLRQGRHWRWRTGWFEW